MVITATGYYNTGSTAVYALLKEYSECSEGVFKDSIYEHVLMYAPNGIFDLADKILIGNNIHRSDEAIYSFSKTMERLYRDNYIWFGNYKDYFGPDFLFALAHFIEEIVDFKVDSTWYYDYSSTKLSFKKFAKDFAKTALKKNIYGDLGRQLVRRQKDGILYSFTDEARFYAAAKEFVQAYFALSSTDPSKKLILDHFLLPHNLYRIPDYFGADFRIFVVDRDPRDVYIQQMERKVDKAPIPLEIDDYIYFWKMIRKSEKQIADSRICRLNFEDLIYNHEETANKIEKFCELDSANHVSPNKFYNPERAINSTKLYIKNTKYQKEIKKIETELPEYLYHG